MPYRNDRDRCRRHRAHLRRARRARDPAGPHVGRSQPGAHVGLCLHNSIAHVELMLGVLQGAVRFRSTSTGATPKSNGSTSSTTPISSSCGAMPTSTRPRFDARVHARRTGAGLRSSFRRRPLRALHGRHDRAAEGRGVAPGRHLLRGARRREPGRAADHRARARSRASVVDNPAQRLRAVPPARRSRTGAVRLARARPARCTRAASGRRSARCSAAARSCSTPSRTSTWTRVLDLIDTRARRTR